MRAASSAGPCAERATDALALALGRRRPCPGLVHHTDRGGHDTATAYQSCLAAHRITCAMSRTGACLDNAMAERSFSTRTTELVAAHRWPTRAAARLASFEWLEVRYSRQHRQAALAYRSPFNFEEQPLLLRPQAA